MSNRSPKNSNEPAEAIDNDDSEDQPNDGKPRHFIFATGGVQPSPQLLARLALLRRLRGKLPILSVVATLLGCSASEFSVASPDDGSTMETTDDAGIDGFDSAPEAPTDSASDAPDALDAAIDSGDTAPPGVGLPCTSSRQCAKYGLECVSGIDPTCSTTDCLRRYTCQPPPPSDTCDPPDGNLPDGGRVNPWLCHDIECVTTADCPAGDNHCVLLLWSDDHDCGTPGIQRSVCSGGTPALDPRQVCDGLLDKGSGPFGMANTVYTCAGDADCIMSDGAGGTFHGTCCSTAVGIRYCAASCTLM